MTTRQQLIEELKKLANKIAEIHNKHNPPSDQDTPDDITIRTGAKLAHLALLNTILELENSTK